MSVRAPEKDIFRTYEEDRQGNVVFLATHVQIRKQSLDLCIACRGQNRAKLTSDSGLPMFARSMKLIKYRINSIGTSRQSTFRMTARLFSSVNESRKIASSSVRLPLRTCSE